MAREYINFPEIFLHNTPLGKVRIVVMSKDDFYVESDRVNPAIVNRVKVFFSFHMDMKDGDWDIFTEKGHNPPHSISIFRADFINMSLSSKRKAQDIIEDMMVLYLANWAINNPSIFMDGEIVKINNALVVLEKEAIDKAKGLDYLNTRITDLLKMESILKAEKTENKIR